MDILIIGIISYLMGSIPFGLLLTKIFLKKDIRDIGSGNIGATNVLRTGNKTVGYITLSLDILKAVIPVIFVKIYYTDFLYLASLCAFIGHVFPVWLKFKGGKGVATYFGAYLAFIFNHPDAFSLDIPYFKVNLVLFFIILYFGLMKIFRISALASLTTIILAGFTVIYSINDSFTITYQVFIILLIFYQHRENLQRLFKGEENKFWI